VGIFLLVLLLSLLAVGVSSGHISSRSEVNIDAENETKSEAKTEAQIEDSTNTRASSNIGASLHADTSFVDTSSNTGVSFNARVSPKSSEKEIPIEPAYRIVLRSLVYPGWGQLYNRKYFKALVVFTSEATLLGMISTESRQASEAYNDHLAARDLATAERLYAEYERHFNRMDSLVWWAAGLVLYSLADAYVDAHLITFEEEFGEPQKKAEISLTTGGYPNGGFVGLKCVF
jgi:hypothetical protein